MKASSLTAAVESVLADWTRQQREAPGVEVHDDRDAVWIVHPGIAWGNAVAGVRLHGPNTGRRLDEIIGRYRSNGRGAGFWLSELSTPADLDQELAQRGFRCRKHFPGMYCDLSQKLPALRPPAGVKFSPIVDHTIFYRTRHPYLGNISTPIRRFELARLASLSSRRPRRAWDFMAVLDEVPIGIATLCLGRRVAGVFDVGVLEDFRGRGIGAALMAHVCRFAKERGMVGAALIASGMGEGVYRRIGFEEVCKMSYWYSSLGKNLIRSIKALSREFSLPTRHSSLITLP